MQEKRSKKKGSNVKQMLKEPEMLAEYDFSRGIRGKYAKRYAEGTNVVVIEPDVAKIFPDHDSVNQALRSLAEIIKRQKKLCVTTAPTWLGTTSVCVRQCV